MKQIDKKFIRSSNLVFISAALGSLNFFFAQNEFTNLFIIFVGLISLFFLVFIGFIIRQGFYWFKYVLLILIALGLLTSFSMILEDFTNISIAGTINILQNILQILSLIILFTIPNKNNIEY